MKKQDAVENQQLLNSIIQQWLAFKRFVLKAYSQEPITPEDEQEFLEVKSQINKVGRMLSDRLKNLGYQGDKIGSMLRQCISVSQLRAMPVPERRGLYKEWHSISINLSQAQGMVDFIAQGWEPRIANTKSGYSIADIKGRKDKGKKKGKAGMIVTVIIILAVVGGAAFVLMNR